MTRRRLVLSIALAARRSQGRSDVAAFASHAQSCGRWARAIGKTHLLASHLRRHRIPIKVVAAAST